MSPTLLLDIARLLGRAGRRSPSGIDRVELAYARHLAATMPQRLRYVAMDGLGTIRQLATIPARRLIDALHRQWSGESAAPAGLRAAARALWVRALLSGAADPRRLGWVQPIYLLVSHKHLHRRNRLESALRAAGARLVVFVHDLIPISFPEFARPGQPELHQARMQTVAALASAIVVNSEATARALRDYLQPAASAPRILVAPLGVEMPTGLARTEQPAGFIAIGTIEPRKNHLLLLQIWRHLSATMGDAAPRLTLVGRRGWENENVIDHLDRSPAIRHLVHERSGASDRDIATLLRGSRALLFPSFAEGYGLPLAEALAVGTPALCSDLPALREVGGDVPEYLHPLDGLGWMQAVQDYLSADSPRREAQLRRMAGWRPMEWDRHFALLTEMLEGLSPLPPGPRERRTTPSVGRSGPVAGFG